MPERSKQALHEIVKEAARESGWQILQASEEPDRALRLQVARDTESFVMLVYIWNLTHGGGAQRPTNEYRIQLTGITALRHESNVVTLLLGWWESDRLFAAFDATKHSGPFGRSPSIQISVTALHTAQQEGLALYNKGKGEIAAGVRPDMLIEYARQIQDVHQTEPPNLQSPPSNLPEGDIPFDDSMLSTIPESRRIVLRALRQRVRQANFQRNVLVAYERQCAMCRTQLDLVEAAHVIPVAHPRSVDLVPNGIALCVLHHRAYDRSLVTIALVDGVFRIALNTREVERLRSAGLLGGYERFKRDLSALYIPARNQDRLYPDFVQIGNEIRGWGAINADEQTTQSDYTLI